MALRTGNASVEDQKKLHRVKQLKQQCNMTDMSQTMEREGRELGLGNQSEMPPLSLALVGPAIESIPQPSVTSNRVLPSRSDLSQFQASQAPSLRDLSQFQASQAPSLRDLSQFQASQAPSLRDLSQFQASQAPSLRDLSQFQASQAPSLRDLSQFQAQRGPSAEDFSKVRGELLKDELEAAKKARDPLWDFRTGEPVETRHSRALRNYSTWVAEESDRKFPFTSREAPRRVSRGTPPTIPSVFADDEDEDDIYGDNDYVDPRAVAANIGHLCPRPGCHYPRYDIRPVGSEPGSKSETPKFKARMGGSSRRRSRNRTPPRKSRKRTSQRKSRKRTPPKRSRTPQRKSRTPRRSRRK
jgi:hypothetical protein